MSFTNDDEKEKIKTFFNACNELIDGRFILFDVKISKLLKCIASSETLYNLFAKCLVGFNYYQELKSCETNSKVNGGYFCIPADEKKVIALVFCIILDINNHKLNLEKFVTKNFFSAEGFNISYSNFANNVLVPFKNSVLNELGIVEGQEKKEEIFGKLEKGQQVAMEEVISENQNVSSPVVNGERKAERKILFANLLISLNELHCAVMADKKIKPILKQEEQMVVGGLIEAIKLENIKIINALIIPLEYILGKQKSVKTQYDKVKDCMIDIYTNLQRY